MVTKKEQRGVAGVEAEIGQRTENVDRLRREIAELEAEAAKLQADLDSCSEKISQKQAQQRTLVVAARSHKDKSAQAELDKLSEEVRRLQDENLQNYAAIEELGSTIKGKREAADQEERRIRYGEALALVEPRTDGSLEARLAELVKQLRCTAEEINASDSAIATALYQLRSVTGAPKGALLREAQEFAYRQSRRRNTISSGLEGVANTLVGGTCTSPGQEAQQFEKLAGMLRMLSAEGSLDGQAA